MWICIAHLRDSRTRQCLPLPVRRRWFPLSSSSARHQPALQDHGYGL